MRKNIIMIAFTLTLIAASCIVGNAADSSFHSQGKIVFSNKTASTRDDVIFDAEDFERLAAVCR